jgi:hypothetical protein
MDGSYLIINAILTVIQELEANLVANLGSQPLVPHTALSRNTQRPPSGQQRDTGPVSLAESPVQQSTLVSNPIQEVDGASRHSPDYAVA